MCLYKTNVNCVKKTNYSDSFSLLNTNVLSFDNGSYICLTCNRSLKKNSLPCQAVVKNLILKDISNEISELNILEKKLVCQRLLFKKIVIMLKGQFPKLEGAITNIPV